MFLQVINYNMSQHDMTAASWISCTVVSLLQWTLARDILIALAIKRIHNLPPHLGYVSTLPTLHKTETQRWRAEAEAHWHLGSYSSGHHRRSHWPLANTAACMCKGKGTSLRTPTHWSGHTASYFRSHFRPTKTGSFRATHTVERKTT